MAKFDPKKLGEEADEMIRSQGQKPEDTETPTTETVEVVEGTEAAPEDAIAQVDSTATTDQGVQSEETLADETVVDSGTALANMQKQLDTAEQRWKVLQGMIDKKDEELNTMRGLLADMSQRPTQEAAAPEQEPAQPLVTDEDVSEYGKEYVDFVARVSTQAFRNELNNNPVMASLDSRLKALEGSVQGVEQTSANTAQTIFFNELTSVVPQWRALNNDASFLQWLDQVDPFTGETKLNLLQHAVAQQDSARAATFFASYEQETAQAPTPAPQETETTAQAPSGKEKLVAPGKTTAAAPLPDSKRNWTRAEITKLYDDKMSGKITAKEFDRLERDLFAAQADGRIAA